MGEDDARIVRVGLPVAVPTLDQFAACILPRLGGVDHTPFAIGLNGKACAPGGKVPRCVLLPAFMLAAHFADFYATMPFMDRTKCRSGFDGLKLLRVADQDNFRACIGDMGEDALHLARADHACLVDDQQGPGIECELAVPESFECRRDGAAAVGRALRQSHVGGFSGRRDDQNALDAAAVRGLPQHLQ